MSLKNPLSWTRSWGAAAAFILNSLLAPVAGAEEARHTLECRLDPLVDVPAVFGLTPERLDALFPTPEGFSQNPFFKWLTVAKDRAIFLRNPFQNVALEMSLFAGTVPVDEVVVDFADGKLNGVTVSVYNRGDSGQIAPDEFRRRQQICDAELRRRLAAVPTPRRADPAAGLLASGSTWFSSVGMATLEKNPEADAGSPEYLKMRIAPRTAEGSIASAMRERTGTVSLTQLKKNVKVSSGANLIQGVPMVDQGAKGYCVVAAAQRLFEYYGISCDQHQLARIARSDAARGTNSAEMIDALESLDQVFHLQFKPLCVRFTDGSLRDPRQMQKTFGPSDFLKAVQRHISDGIPLLWGLNLGEFPEQPALSRQVSGGHMRLIVGFDGDRIYFSDSWGPGHELGSMAAEDAFRATNALLVMHPKLR